MSEPTKSDLIREVLRRRYPCQEIPQGHLTKIGQEFGVTRELVRQVARKMNIGWQPNRVTKRRLCKAGCGEVPDKKMLYCDGCREIPVSCSVCGTVFRLPRNQFLKRLAPNLTNWNSTGRRIREEWFCSRACSGSFVGKTYGFGGRR